MTLEKILKSAMPVVAAGILTSTAQAQPFDAVRLDLPLAARSDLCINGNTLAWRESLDEGSRIVTYNLTTGQQTTIAEVPYRVHDLGISDFGLAWSNTDAREAYLWTPQNGMERISQPGIQATQTDIAGNSIIYRSRVDDRRAIQIWNQDFGTLQVSRSHESPRHPRLSEQAAVWQSSLPGGGYNEAIVTYDRKTHGVHEIYSPHSLALIHDFNISHSNVGYIYSEFKDDKEVFYVTLSDLVGNATPVATFSTDSTILTGDIELYNNTLVWTLNLPGVDSDVMLWTPELGLHNLTPDNLVHGSPAVYGNKVAWLQYDADGLSSIYMTTIPSPATAVSLGLVGLLATRRKRNE